MKSKRTLSFSLIVAVFLLISFVVIAGADGPLTPIDQLGNSIFFDQNLSINQNQSCAYCHGPEVGFTGPLSETNLYGSVYEGSIPHSFGDRPPSAAYATLSPIFHMDKKGLFIGGNFWDGRATGKELGNPAADQALGPFLNPVEQALPDSACVVYRVCNADYLVSFEDVWGEQACAIDWPDGVESTCAKAGGVVVLSEADRATSDMAYDNVGLSIAAYEGSPEVNAFNSKLDQTFDGKVKLSKEELRGYALFRGKGKCHLCHTANGQDALFTDFTFDNLGIPKNPDNPVYVGNPTFVDPGLGGFLMKAGYSEEIYMAEWGKQKVPTPRNVDKRPYEGFKKAYTHNGYFKTLEGLVNFYNTRDVKPVWPGAFTEAEALAADCWPPPEVPQNVNTAELGNLGLTPDEETAIVAFLKALSDLP
jgi:cytochrome c peroxidase